MILSAADSVAGKSYGILVNLSKWDSSASVYLVKEGCRNPYEYDTSDTHTQILWLLTLYHSIIIFYI